MRFLRSISLLVVLVLTLAGCTDYGTMGRAEIEEVLSQELKMTAVVLTESDTGGFAGTAQADDTTYFLVVRQDPAAHSLHYEAKDRNGALVRQGTLQ